MDCCFLYKNFLWSGAALQNWLWSGLGWVLTALFESVGRIRVDNQGWERIASGGLAVLQKAAALDADPPLAIRLHFWFSARIRQTNPGSVVRA